MYKYFFQSVAEPTIDFAADFDCTLRKEGLSGFMRLRNEGEFLKSVILSWIDALDELIIVFNNCHDNTEQIAHECAEKYPDKIKIYHYLPVVYPQGSLYNLNLPTSSPHSIVNYYNFALSRTSRKWTIKIDGDIIIPNKDICVKLRELYNFMNKHTPNEYLAVSGINLINHYGEFYVPNNSKYAGYYGDLCLFRCDTDTVFKKSKTLEKLDLSKRTKAKQKRIFLYYHMKFVKQDFGMNNYDFVNNPNSHYIQQYIDFLVNLKLLPLRNFLAKTGLPMVSCSQFGLKNNGNWKTRAIRYLLNSINNSYYKDQSSFINAKQLGFYKKYSFQYWVKLLNKFWQKVYKFFGRMWRRILHN